MGSTRCGDHLCKSVDRLNPSVSYSNGWFDFITSTEINIFFSQSTEYDLQINIFYNPLHQIKRGSISISRLPIHL